MTDQKPYTVSKERAAQIEALKTQTRARFTFKLSYFVPGYIEYIIVCSAKDNVTGDVKEFCQPRRANAYTAALDYATGIIEAAA